MLLTIHQPECFPWIGFIDKMRRADAIVLLDNVQFKKNYFENRNKIRTRQGWTWLTVPVLTKGRSAQLIGEVEILPAPQWRRKIVESLRQNYGKAPHWDHGGEEICALIERPWTRLVDLNLAVIAFLFERFEIRAEITLGSTLGTVEHGSELVLEICRAMGASRYLSGRDGKNYLNEAAFTQAGIEVKYQDFHHPEYPQIHGEFMSGMSALDLWFHCGPDSRKLIEEANP